jgi:hypothetical protein
MAIYCAVFLLGFTLAPPGWQRQTSQPWRAAAPQMQAFDISNIPKDQKDAILAAYEAQEKAAEEARVAEGLEAWKQLEEGLPALPSSAAPVLTLYRDTNGWCPFCERVWVQLNAKGIPYREELINLQDKPDWYKKVCPCLLRDLRVPFLLFAHVALLRCRTRWCRRRSYRLSNSMTTSPLCGRAPT